MTRKNLYKKIPNTEIAQKVYEVLQEDKERQYKDLTFEKILNAIDIERNTKVENTEVSEDIIRIYIDGFKANYELI
jgi:hypothetical protein